MWMNARRATVAVWRCVWTPRAPDTASVIRAVWWTEADTVAEVLVAHESSLLQSRSIWTKLFLSFLMQRLQVVTSTMEAAAMPAPPFWCNCPGGLVLGEDKHACQGVLQCVCVCVYLCVCVKWCPKEKKKDLEANQLTCRGELTQGNLHTFIWKDTHTCRIRLPKTH